MAFSKDNKPLADDYKALFTRLEALRKKHAARAGLTSAQSTALSTTISTSLGSGQPLKPADVTAVKDAVTVVANSPDISSTFVSNITIPSVGALLSSDIFSNISADLTTMEGICANCANFTSSASQGNHSSNHSSNFSSNFTSAASKGNFTSSSSQGNWSATWWGSRQSAQTF